MRPKIWKNEISEASGEKSAVLIRRAECVDALADGAHAVRFGEEKGLCGAQGNGFAGGGSVVEKHMEISPMGRISREAMI